MWTASRAPSAPQRSTSIHSIASMHSASRPNSMVSSPQLQRRSGYESDQSSDTGTEDELIMQNANFPSMPANNMPAMWQTQRQNSGSAVSRLSQKFASNVNLTDISASPPLRTQHRHQPEPMESSPDDDTHSRSSTLGGEEQDFEFPEKTPTSLPRAPKIDQLEDEDESSPSTPAAPPHVPGPLESQLATLMSKLVFMERENPVVSVSPEDYEEMRTRLKALEEEKRTWQKRHEALFALRDEDVENNIKIRGLLAKTRRDLEAMTKLRDEDLVNVQAVRSKLAEATRSLERQGQGQSQPQPQPQPQNQTQNQNQGQNQPQPQIQTQNQNQSPSQSQSQSQSQNGRSSPSRARPGSIFMERRNTMDLFAVAKTAALEQRALELEKRNSDLLSQIETLKGGASIDDLNRMTAHQAWKDTVADLELKIKAKDTEMARLRINGATVAPAAAAAAVAASVPAGSGGATDWQRMEALHEEHAGYRERVGGKMQALRSEKERLQRELYRKEDENHALEVKVQSLQRRVNLMV